MLQDAANAICFDLGEFPQDIAIPQCSEAGIDFRLPFPICWFQLTRRARLTGEAVHICFLAMEVDARIDVMTFQFSNSLGWACIGVSNFDCLPPRAFGSDGISADEQLAYARVISHFVVAMSCRNVTRREIKPDAALQRARTRRGRLPLFSYWVLELHEKDGAGRADLGGTHASPRVHLRRGHSREYAPGKFTWVQPTMVGNKKLGMVHKDYVAGAGLMTEPTLH